MRPNPKYPIVIDYHITIGPAILPTDPELFFGPKPKNLIHMDRATIWDILVQTECFSSKKDAQRNWKGITQIPSGYFELGPIGKAKVMIFGLNPQDTDLVG